MRTDGQSAVPLDIEPLLGMPGDVARGEVVAQNKCSNCHGKNGVSGRIGAPFIGGQSYEYLLRALAAYVNGQRDHQAMKGAMQGLEKEALVNVARYYASQTRAKWDPSVTSTQSEQIVINARTIAEGERLSKACNSCHGEQGVSNRPLVPSLAGMHAEYFIKTLNEFFRGERQHEIMQLFKESVSKQNAEFLAAYYANLQPKKNANPVSGVEIDGHMVAVTQCAGCHGTDGNSIAPGMPGIAGQDAAYLAKTTRDYRDGIRKDGMMAAATKSVTDKQIEDVSAYYATQSPDPYVRATSHAKSQFDPLSDAGKMAKLCDGCHGPDGNSKRSAMPSLTGLTPDYLVASTLSYRSGERRHKEMNLLLEGLTDLDIEKISYYYATRNTQSSDMPGKGNVAEGKKQSAICASCHDKVGAGADPRMPTLAGQNAAYIIQASEDYINGMRKHKVMHDAVVMLPKEIIANIAAYYAMLKPVRLNIRMPEPPEALAASCDSCHGPRGYPRNTTMPRLAGQTESYIVRVLREYGTGKRISSPMHVNSIALTQLESRAIAAYYAAQ